MKNISIYLLKKKSIKALNAYIKPEILAAKKNNNKIKKETSDSLFIFNLDKTMLNEYNISGKIYLYKQYITANPWIVDVNNLSEKKIDIEDESFFYKSLIIIKKDSQFYAISYSRGYTLLEDENIISDFGTNIAKKMIKRSKLQAIKNIEFGQNLKNQFIYSSTNLVDSLDKYFQNMSMLNKIVGQTSLKFNSGSEIKELNLHLEGKNNITLSGNISLKNDLIPIILKLNEIYLNENLPEQIMISNEIQKETNPKLISKYNNLLLQKLNSLNSFYLTHKEISENKLKKLRIEFTPNKKLNLNMQYKIAGLSKWTEISELQQSEFLCNIFKLWNKKQSAHLMSFFKNKKIYFKQSDDLETNSDYIKLINLIYFEATYSENYIIFFKGQWYKINKSIYKKVTEIVNSISNNHKEIDFKAFDEAKYVKNGKKSEGAYNEAVPLFDKNKNKVFCLDRKNFSPERSIDLNKNSVIEPCDLIKVSNNNPVLCHIKRGKSSSGLSHLLSQVRVSSHLLISDNKFLEHINNSLPDDKQLSSQNKYHIILGCIVSKNDCKKKNSVLFPLLFNLNLANLYTELIGMNFEVSLVKIPTINTTN